MPISSRTRPIDSSCVVPPGMLYWVTTADLERVGFSMKGTTVETTVFYKGTSLSVHPTHTWMPFTSEGDAGYSVYRGVRVVWDEDYDTRVLQAIDEMREEDRREAFLMAECEANSIIVWLGPVPSAFRSGYIDVRNDHWELGNYEIAEFLARALEDTEPAMLQKA